MPKVTLNKTTFELSEDNFLILQGYLGKLELYHMKGSISRAQVISIESALETRLLENLGANQDISIDRMHSLIQSAEQSAGWKLPRDGGSFLGSFFRGTFHLLAGIVWLICKCIRVFAFLALGMLCVALFLGIFVLLPLVLLNPIIDNQVMFGALPEITKWILMVLEIGFVLLSIGFLYGIWQGSALHKHLLVFGAILIILGANGATYIATHIVYNYGNVYTRTSSQEILIRSGNLSPVLSEEEQKKLDLSLTRANMDFRIPLSRVEIISGTGDIIHIDTQTRVFAENQALANQYFDTMRPLQFSLSGSHLVVDPIANGTAMKPMSYQGLFRTIRIIGGDMK